MITLERQIVDNILIVGNHNKVQSGERIGKIVDNTIIKGNHNNPLITSTYIL